MQFLVVRFSKERHVIINGVEGEWKTNEVLQLQAGTHVITLALPPAIVAPASPADATPLVQPADSVAPASPPDITAPASPPDDIAPLQPPDFTPEKIKVILRRTTVLSPRKITFKEVQR